MKGNTYSRRRPSWNTRFPNSKEFVKHGSGLFDPWFNNTIRANKPVLKINKRFERKISESQRGVK